MNRKNVEDLYPLSPLQQGMLFDTLFAPESATFVEQVVLTLAGTVRPDALGHAWQRVVERTPALRTGFVWEGVPKPLQVVFREAALPFVFHDWSELAESERDRSLSELIADDRARAFTLASAPLMRLALVRFGGGEHRLLFSFHHLLLDRASISLVVREALAIHADALNGAEPSLPRRRPFRDYIAWLGRQDAGAMEAFWRERLRGFDAPTPLPLDGDPARRGISAEQHAEERIVLPATLLTALEAAARHYDVTVRTVMQGAWGVVLARYAATDDVVFGATVSGRPTDLPGVEATIGMFGNAIPVRLRTPDALPVAEWLRAFHEAQLDARQWEHAPQAAVKGWSEVAADRPLFESILVFDGLPLDSTNGGSVGPAILGAYSTERADHALSLAIAPAPEGTRVTASYDSRRLDAQRVLTLLAGFRTVLGQIVEGASRTVDTLTPLGAAEQQRIQEERSGAPARFLAESSIPAHSDAERGPATDRFALPRTPTESMLVRVWTEVLRVDRVGIHDNLFALGADSLLVIQAISRAAKEGVRITPRQVLLHPTVAELAAVASGAPEIEAEQGVVTGQVPLTPAQRWFLERDLAVPAHFNLSIALASSEPLDPALVQQALDAVATHHDALRLRFTREGGEWRQAYAMPAPVPLDVVDADGDTEAALMRAQAGLDLADGPLFRVVLLRRGASAVLALVAHHLVVDAASWRVLTEDVATALDQLVRGDSVALAAKTTSFRDWSERLSGHGATLGSEADFWRAALAGDAAPLPVDRAGGRNTHGTATSITVALDGDKTRALLQELPTAYRTQLSDALLAALARSFHTWTGTRTLLVDVHGHGREDLFRGADLSRTVGVFTTLYPVRVDARPGAGRVAALRDTAERLRAIPNHGIGFGLLRYLAAPDEMKELPQPQVSFSYLGQSGGAAVSAGRLSFAAESVGSEHDPANTRTHLLEVTAMVSGGQLHVTWNYSAEVHEAETIERLAARYLDELRGLVAEVRAGERMVTPADFPLAHLSQEGLDLVLAGQGGARAVEDIYPLTPLQAGMLFHSQFAPESGVYVERFGVTINGELDEDALIAGWQGVVDRHPVLRTAFVTEGVDTPVQVVKRAAIVPVRRLDLRELTEDERAGRLAELTAEDGRRGFDLARAPLLRIALARTGEKERRFLITFHHILLDGWSLTRVFTEANALYDASVREAALDLPQPRPFRDYVAWLERQDRDAAEAFWRRTLAGFAPPPPLGIDRAPGQGTPGTLGETSLRLDADEAETLRTFARRARITFNTLFQGAWALLLARYSGADDVVFGNVVSGRPAELAGVEEIVGMLINTLPVRVPVAPSQGVTTWLRALQERQTESRQHEHTPLADVQRWSGLGGTRPLFETLYAFENFPLPIVDAADASALEETAPEVYASDVSIVERTNYPLNLVVLPGAELELRLNFDSDRFDAAAATRLLTHYRAALRGLAAVPDGVLGDLTFMDSEEHDWLVAGLNGTATDFPRHAAIHELWEEQVRAAPHAPALVHGERTYSYAELNESANRLAEHLRSLGVAPESRVALSMDRSADFIVTLLAILKAGGAYVPLDPTYPAERLAFMVADSGSTVLVVADVVPDALDGFTGPIVSLRGDAERIAAHSGADTEGAALGGESLAYVIYTSGSTGLPKGIAVPQRGVVRLVRDTDFAQLRADDRVGHLSNTSFDAATWEVWGALLNGARLVVLERAQALDARALGAALAGSGVTAAFLTSSLFTQMSHDAPASFGSMRHLLVGGEAVDPAAVRRVRAAGGPERLLNGYGPTESTTFATWHLMNSVEASASSVPIGLPIANTTAYVLDERMRLVPAGTPGELYLGGAGVARGYHGRPSLTADRFLPDPFGAEPGGRIYRTGDRVRRDSTGVVEYLGRFDAQVKIRGFRIEPGEVEAALAAEAGVRDAVVIVRQDVPGERRLVAYVVGHAGTELSSAGLRGALAQRLPDYMVPAAVVILDALPLTPNGKTDTRALPAPESTEDGGAYVAPATPTEEAIVRVWMDVLGVERVGAEDDFFALGGHSLLAMRVVSRLRGELGLELPIVMLFEERTPRAIAARLDAPGGSDDDGAALPALLPRGADSGPLPLSFAQERMFFLERLEPDAGAYNITLALEAAGALDLDALAAALSGIAARHEVLRTTFAEEDGRAVQHIHPAAPVEVTLPQVDTIEEARQRAAEAMRRPFDLTREMPIRATVFRVAPELHLVLVVLHHAAADGWSVGLLLDEITALYSARVAGTGAALPPVPLQYADFAAWQRRVMTQERLEREVAFWRGALADAPAVLDLPTDRSRPAVQSHRGAVEPIHIPADLARRLDVLAAEEGATPFMLILAAWGSLLGRLAGQGDVVVGTPVAGRTRSETERVVGMFVNTLPLRVTTDDDPSFRALLRRVRDTTLSALAHEDLPFERLVEELGVERSMAHAPVFQSLFALQNAPTGGGLSFPGVELSYAHVEGRAAKFDLALDLTPLLDGGMAGVVEYATDLFDRDTVVRVAERLVRFLEAIADEPARRVAEIELDSLEERQRLRARAEGVPPTVEPKAAHRLFEASARTAPGAPALVADGERLTYAELDRRANRLARRLQDVGVGPDVRVALLLERGADPVIGALAVWKAGGAYLPIDPAYPAERRAYMLADSGVAIVLTRASHAAEAAAGGARVVLIEMDDPTAPDVAVSADVWPESAAYIIYTSGSTGRPKGVVVPHRGIANLSATLAAGFEIDAASRNLQFASFSFDAALAEVVSTFAAGACLVTVPTEAAVPGPELIRWMRAEQVTVATVPPSVLAALADADLPDLRTVVSAGEAVPAEIARHWAAGRRMVNAYGPTENTVCVALSRVDAVAEGGRVPIGPPTPGVGAAILDRALRMVPEGSAGELFVGGVSVARGYLGRPALTAERFLPDPFSREPGARMYRTGDRVRWNAAGELEFLGRVDEQVKIRGFRVEPGEVEAALSALPGVRQAIVVAMDAPGGTRLVGYVVAETDSELDTEGLRGALGKSLPAHMVPAAVVLLDSLPLTPNGKIDRRALPALEWTAGQAQGVALTPTQEIVAGVWGELLGAAGVRPDDDFFTLGGHSLLATQVVSRVRRVFGVELPIRSVFEAPALASFADRIDAAVRAGAGSTDAPPVLAVPRDGDVTASFAQERLWVLQRMDPESPAYNIPTALRVAGALDTLALERALGEIVARHEALRTVFAEHDGVPVQRILPPAPFHLAVTEAGDHPPKSRDDVARQAAADDAARPFDLAAGPLFRATLVRLAPDDHVLLLNVHHAVADGWSMGVIFSELTELYTAFRAGKPSPLAPLAVQYPDFAVWQREWLRGETLDKQLGYWRDRLSGAPSLLQLPTDRPRPAVQSHGGGTVVRVVPRALLERAEALSRQEGATLFMVLLAAFNVVVGRLAGQDDVVVGTPIAGRTRHETEGLIGLFLNTLALRTRMDGDPSFRELLGRVREVTLGAYAHQDIAFERLLEELRPERSLSHTPVFQVMLNLVNVGGGIALPDLDLSVVDPGDLPSKFDFTLYASETEHGLHMQLIYAAELFDAERMDELLRQLEGVIEGAVADPGRRIAALSLVTPEARAVLPDTATKLSAEWRGSVHDRFAEHAARTPDALAVADPREQWSYAELDAASSRIANRLIADGVRPGDVVAVYAHRNAAIVRALLGIMRSGGAFLMLDPAYPGARLAEYLRAATPKALLHIAAAGALPDELAAGLAGIPTLSLGARGASVDDADGLADVSHDDPRVPVGADSLAYLAFTSGTTGEPKAVLGGHGSLTHFTPWLAEMFQLGPTDRFSMLAGLSHDPFQRDIFIPLQLGAAVIAPEPEEIGTPGYLAEWMRAETISAANLAPAMVQWVAGLSGTETVPSLRRAFFVGEALTRAETDRLHRLAPGVTIVNLYGATETQRALSYQVVERGAGSGEHEVIPLGKGMPGVQLLVRTAEGGPAGIGEAGDVWIRSPHLALGYLADASLTESRFVPTPDADDPTDRMYRTGDLGRYRLDGVVDPLGRADGQVKVRGFRVELGEVEAALARHPAVREAAVVARGEGADRRLIAYFVPTGDDTGADALRQHLRALLPEFMIPADFVELEALPLTANRKVDRAALPEPKRAVPARVAPPRTPMEEVVAAIWAEVLGRDSVGVDEDFFAAGGHSLRATQVLSRIETALGVRLRLRTLFESPTVAGLSAAIEAEGGGELAAMMADLNELTDAEIEALLAAEAADEQTLPTESR